MEIDREAYFWQVQDGRKPQPPVGITLGNVLKQVSPDEGTIEIEYDGKLEFTNPAGNIMGGFLAAMLDSAMGQALSATLGANEFAPTLNLNISFLRPAMVGKFRANGRIVRKGRDVCYLSGELYQGDELIATATATALIRKR